MNALLLFGCTFCLVFAFGFMNRGGYVAAFASTFAIGVAYLVVFTALPLATRLDVAGYLLGGPFGIVASMVAHRRWREREWRRHCLSTYGRSVAGDIYDPRAPWRKP